LRFEVVDTETSERIDFEWVSQESFLGDRDFGVRRQLAIPVYLEAGETEPKEYDIVIYAVGSPTLYSVKLCPATLTWVMPFHTDREKFTSKERDKETGLDYFGARYYASWLSRWLSVDPVRGKVGDSQSWNRYIYVQNNPLRLIDPNGTTITASNNIEEARQQLEVLKTAAGAGGKHLQVVPFEKKVLWSKVTGYRIEATDLQALSKSGIVGNALASWIASSAILNINWAGFWSDQATPSQGGANTTFSNEGATINMRPEYYEKPRKFGDVTQTMASAFIHELGHSLYKLFPSLIERNNKGEFGRVETEIFPEYNRDEAFPLYFENLNRSAEEQRKYYANPGDYTPPKVPPQYPLW
jgi:RHS repeat-associated protein